VLLGVIQGSEVRGVSLVHLHPGHVATIWPPSVRWTDDELGERLAVAAADLARHRGAAFAQAQLAVDEVREKTWLEKANLCHVADIECLLWLPLPSDRSEDVPIPSNLSLERYVHPAQRGRLEPLLAQTWIDTLDCTALEGMRNAADALDNYLAAGDSGAEHWYFLRGGGQDAGCLLLAEHRETDEMELVYMGLAPPWRGQGLGHVLTRCAQKLTRRADRACLTTAVDTANLLARAVYQAAGLVACERRQVLLLRFV